MSHAKSPKQKKSINANAAVDGDNEKIEESKEVEGDGENEGTEEPTEGGDGEKGGTEDRTESGETTKSGAKKGRKGIKAATPRHITTTTQVPALKCTFPDHYCNPTGNDLIKKVEDVSINDARHCRDLCQA